MNGRMRTRTRMTEEFVKRCVNERRRLDECLSQYCIKREGRNKSLKRFVYLLNEYRVISSAIDGKYYRMRYGEGIRDVALHYLTKGSILGLDPHPLFNTKWYLSQNLDVVDSGVAPFFHYLAAG